MANFAMNKHTTNVTNPPYVPYKMQMIKRAFSYEEFKRFTGSGGFRFDQEPKSKVTTVIAEADNLMDLQLTLEFLSLQIDMMLEDIQMKLEGELMEDYVLREEERNAISNEITIDWDNQEC